MMFWLKHFYSSTLYKMYIYRWVNAVVGRFCGLSLSAVNFKNKLFVYIGLEMHESSSTGPDGFIPCIVPLSKTFAENRTDPY